MKLSIFPYLVKLFALSAFVFSQTLDLHAAYTGRIQVDVAVEAGDTPSVTLTWDSQLQDEGDTGDGEVMIYRRDFGLEGMTGGNEYQLLETVDYPGTEYVDLAVELGQRYEYRVYRPYYYSSVRSAGYQSCSAYIAVGVDAELIESLGTVLLVVDSEAAASLTDELSLLEMDLVGDGWQVERLDFAPEGIGSHLDLKDAIVTACSNNPAINTIYLFGHLPIARSGLIAPDGHSPWRAHETDQYYADLDGVWTDTTANQDYSSGDPAEVDNLPGDGKFDQNKLPSLVDLQAGRVDFSGMTAYRKGEREYLRDYIQKAHAWKHGYREVPYRGLNDEYSRYLEEVYTWMLPFFGQNVTGEEFRPTLSYKPMIMSGRFLMQSGTVESEYTAVDNKTIIGFIFASYNQHWARSNAPMRGVLAQPDWGLNAAWGSRPHDYFHHLSVGQTTGYSIRRVANNDSSSSSGYHDYYPAGSSARYVHINLMGDPTLRLNPVKPVTEVLVADEAGVAVLTWSAPEDSTRVGFHVYRSQERLGEYTRLTQDLLAPEVRSFTDQTPPASGVTYYQVRAVALTEVPTGSYYNQSQGAFALLHDDGSGSQPPEPEIAEEAIQVASNMPTRLHFPGADVDGDDFFPVVIENPENGQIRWSGGIGYYVSSTDYTGGDRLTYCLSDGLQQSAPIVMELDVVAPEDADVLLGWSWMDSLSEPASTFNDSRIGPSSLVLGPGLKIKTTSHAFGLSGAQSSGLDLNDYVSWSLQPEAGSALSVERVTFFLYSSGAAITDPYPAINAELRMSVDGFDSYTTLPLDQGSLIEAFHQSTNGGVVCSADTSEFSALQNMTAPVEFRIYIWNTSSSAICGIGKSGDNSAQRACDLTVFGQIAPVIPVADAGEDLRLTDGNYTVSLDGGDSVGLDLNYSWSQVSGPAVILNDASTLHPHFSAALAGTYEFELLVNNAGGSDSDTVIVTLDEGDIDPFVSAGGNQYATIGDTVSMLGEAYDLDGDSLTLEWTFVSGPETVILADSDQLGIEFTPTLSGRYVFALTGVANGVEVSDQVTVVVTASNVLWWGGGASDLGGTSINELADDYGNMDGTWNSSLQNWNANAEATNAFQTWIDGSHAFLRVDSSYNSTITPDVRLAEDIVVGTITAYFPEGALKKEFDLTSLDSTDRVLTLGENPWIHINYDTGSNIGLNFKRRGGVSGKGAVLLGGSHGFNFRVDNFDGTPSHARYMDLESSVLSGEARVHSGNLNIGSSSSNATGLPNIDSLALIGNIAYTRVYYNSVSDNRLSDSAALRFGVGSLRFAVPNDNFSMLESVDRMSLDGSGMLYCYTGRTNNVGTLTLSLANGLDRGTTGMGTLVTMNTYTTGGLGVTSGNGLVLQGHGLPANSYFPWAVNFGLAEYLDGSVGGTKDTGFLCTDSSGQLMVRASEAGSATLSDAAWLGYDSTSDVTVNNQALSGALGGDVNMRSLAISLSSSSTLDLNGATLTTESFAFGDKDGRSLYVGTNDSGRGIVTSDTGVLYMMVAEASIASTAGIHLRSVIDGDIDVVFAAPNGRFSVYSDQTYTGRTFVQTGYFLLEDSVSFDYTSEINLAPGAKFDCSDADFTLGRIRSQILSGGGNIYGSIRPNYYRFTMGSHGILSPGNPGMNQAFCFNFEEGGKLAFTPGSRIELDLNTADDSDRISFFQAGDWFRGYDRPALDLNLGEEFDYSDTYILIDQVTTPGFGFSEITGYDRVNYVPVVTHSGNAYLLDFILIPEVLAVPGSAYEDWAAEIEWMGADGAAEADPNLDGVTNFLAFALGLNPLQPIGPGDLPNVTYDPNSAGGPWLLYDFRVNAAETGLNYELLTSFNLETWDPLLVDDVNVIEEQLGSDGDADLMRVWVKTDTEVGCQFLRLRISE
ncbi:MAG: hypothetical protein CML13_16625 [Puniceicoccaceae bacterium]|nr:hypothetical protein [Puniceicoccaceae bacterium]|tara:strand:- start:15349 stop:21015 length:5667 start_codon:yes stop_codon:yes gene_type:complete